MMQSLKGWEKIKSSGVKNSADKVRKAFKIALIASSGTNQNEIATALRAIYKSRYNDYCDEDESGVDHKDYKSIIQSNAFQAMTKIVSKISGSRDAFSNEDEKKCINSINSFQQLGTHAEVPREIWMCFKTLWKDGEFKKLAEKSTERELFNEAEYYFANIDRISAGTYEPSSHDVLMCRAKLKGIVKSPLKKNVWLLEIGSISSVRTALKTLQLFDDKTVVIFCVDALLYNQFGDDGKTNKLTEAVSQFEEITKNKAILDSLVFLLFIKKDEMEIRLQNDKLSEYFPGFQAENDLTNACKFISKMFETPKQKYSITSLYRSDNDSGSPKYKSNIKYAVNFCISSMRGREMNF